MATKTAPTIEQITKANPKVDGEAVAQTIKIVRELRKLGVDGPQYGLASPYGHEIHAQSEAWLDRSTRRRDGGDGRRE